MTRIARPLLWFGLVAAALAGMALVLYATRYGPGVGGDATIYLTSAQNLLAGRGLGWVEADGSFRTLPYSPPFYPLVLSALGLVTSDLVAGARWLNLLLFGATTLLAGWYTYRATRSTVLAVLAAVSLALSPVIIGVQVWAMSEPLFLLLGFGGLFLLLEYFDKPRWGLLIAAALLAGMAFLTRYIGVSFVAAGGLALLLFGRSEERSFRLRFQRLPEALLYGVTAILPILIWLVIDFSLTGTVGSRSAQPASAYWQRLLEMCPALERIYLFWLLPDSLIDRLPGFARLVLWLVPMVGVVFLVAVLARRLRADRSRGNRIPGGAVRFPALMALFIAVYLFVLTIVQVFTYPPITLAARMLSPVHFAAVLLVFGLVHLLLDVFVPRYRAPWAAAALVCLGFAAFYGLRSARIAADYHNTGIGYTSPTYRDAPVVKALREMPGDIPLISNETTAIMFLVGRPAYALQEIYQDQPLQEFSRYGEGDDAAQRVFREQGGALVLFQERLYEDFAMYGERAEERIDALTEGLYLYYSGEDGAIYFFQQPEFASP